MIDLALVESEPVTGHEYHLTDLGNAERLVAEHGQDLRYAPGVGWHAWDGRRWKRDTDGEPLRRAKETVLGMYADAAKIVDSDDRKKLLAWAAGSESVKRLGAMVKLAEIDRAVIVQADKLDADPWLFNAANGTIDLQTGDLRDHRRDDLLTKISGAAYHRGADSQRWRDFLHQITDGDQEYLAFLKRAAGYSLTGHTSEEVIFFVHGPSATGKSTFLEAVRTMLGEYATVADFETFLKRRGDAGVRNDIARLVGARFVVSLEVDDGKALAEGLLKALTGGDIVAARFLYSEVFEFHPRFKLWFAANERPRVRADDEAMWRRILQLPFNHVVPEDQRDERIKLELRTDPDVQAAILAWAVEGCLNWQQTGLNVPASVRDYTAEYRAENDPLRDWLTDCCETDENAWTPIADLRASYETWCETNGEKPVTAKQLGTLLGRKGNPDKRTGKARGRLGIRLTPTNDA